MGKRGKTFMFSHQLTGADVVNTLPRQVLVGLFDKQVALLTRQLDRAVEDMEVQGALRELYDCKRSGPKETPPARGILDVILLSGGLGSSEYVLAAIEGFVRDNGRPKGHPNDPMHANLRSTQVLVSSEPQHCVAMGLLDVLFEPRGDRLHRKWSAFGLFRKRST
jgi:hypothetical protein